MCAAKFEMMLLLFFLIFFNCEQCPWMSWKVLLNLKVLVFLSLLQVKLIYNIKIIFLNAWTRQEHPAQFLRLFFTEKKNNKRPSPNQSKHDH